MKLFLTTVACLFATSFAIAIGCAPAEPVVQEVEVTRLVVQTLEVPVTEIVVQPVEVTRIATVEVPVPQTVEVTRFATVEVPVTRLVTPSAPRATPTPRPTATKRPTPIPTPSPVPLAQREEGNLFVFLKDGDYFMTVLASPAFDVDTYDLTVLVDGTEYCNDVRIYADDGAVELTCAAEERSHSDVERVSVQTPKGDLRCGRHVESTAALSVFLCVWR